MNKRIKSIIAITIVTMMSSQIFIMQKLNTVKAENISSTQISSENKNLGGFQLKDKKWISDLNCNAYIYTHIKSGASLVFLDDKNENKIFSINFKTPAKDNTGENHIIEHSLLEGSKNYPVKNLLSEVKKQSLATDINAKTMADFTSYPISSKNHKDYENLMGIYLDAVFYPNVLNDKKLFDQEGIRYELDSKDSELKYNGIVYNEMKGHYSIPDWALNNAINKSLFPDTSYKYESGGLPEAIPDLTYDQLKKTYNENYTPSNSLIYLSGNLDINKTLKFIGDKYLNNFDKKEVSAKNEAQKPFSERKIEKAQYSIPMGASAKNKSKISLNYVIEPLKNKEVNVAFLILNDLLTKTPNSPLLKAMRENGFGENVTTQINIFTYQPVFSIIASNVNEEDKDKFEKVVNDTLKNIVANGFDENFVNSILNFYELSNRALKGDYGMIYKDLAVKSWMETGEPCDYINLNEDMKNIQQKIKQGYMKDIIQKYLVDNKYVSTVILNAEPGLQERKDIELKQKLSRLKASMSQAQINDLVEKTKELKAWQSQPNSIESLNSIPKLTREDLQKQAKEYKTEEKKEEGVTVLHHPMFTNGVNYINLYFDTLKVPQDKLGYLYLLNGILNVGDTKKYSRNQLTQELISISQGMSITNVCVPKRGSDSEYYPKNMISFQSLNENIGKNFDILNDIIYNIDLTNKEKIKETISEMKNGLQMQMASAGVDFAIKNISSYYLNSAKYDRFQNDSLCKFLSDLEQNFDKNSDEIIKNLQNVRNLVFNKQDMLVSYTGEEKDYKNFADSFNKFSMGLKNEKLETYKYSFDESKVNEGVIVPTNVQSVVKGGNLKRAGYESNGGFLVLQNILTQDYLWNNIRVKGGAYGTGAVISDSNVVFYSSSDPNIKETLNTFDKIPEYIKNLNIDENKMDGYIIGTIGNLDNANDYLRNIGGPSADGLVADNLYIGGITQSDLQKERDEIINLKAEDIKKFSQPIESILKQDYLCVVGGDTKIKENKENFMIIKDVLNAKEQEGKVINMEQKENITSDKVWNVKFSKELNELTINESNIYVLDKNNHPVKIKISYDKQENSIKIQPEELYKKDNKYTLYVKGLESKEKDGNVLRLLAPIKMEFTTEK